MENYKDYCHKIDWEAVHDRASHLGLLRQRFGSATTYFEKLNAISQYWQYYEPKIIELAKKSSFNWFTSYPIDWNLIFTPIEREAWMSIRTKGGIIMYPQYPVLNFHVDFGNPYLKIALEIDGKAFHDAERDYQRDFQLKEIGWKVYRIPGDEMVRRNYKDFSDFTESEAGWEYDGYEDIQDWILNTGDGVIEAIKAIHFIKSARDEETRYFLDFCEMTLMKHSYFPE